MRRSVTEKQCAKGQRYSQSGVFCLLKAPENNPSSTGASVIASSIIFIYPQTLAYTSDFDSAARAHDMLRNIWHCHMTVAR